MIAGAGNIPEAFACIPVDQSIAMIISEAGCEQRLSSLRNPSHPVRVGANLQRTQLPVARVPEEGILVGTGFIGKHNFPLLIHSLDDIAISRSPNKIRGDPASDNSLREPATYDVDKSWFENADFSLPLDHAVFVEPSDHRCASLSDSFFGYA